MDRHKINDEKAVPSKQLFIKVVIVDSLKVIPLGRSYPPVIIFFDNFIWEIHFEKWYKDQFTYCAYNYSYDPFKTPDFAVLSDPAKSIILKRFIRTLFPNFLYNLIYTSKWLLLETSFISVEDMTLFSDMFLNTYIISTIECMGYS